MKCPDLACSEDQFLKDVRNHTMTIDHDDGVYRTLHFGKGTSSVYHFKIITVPGYLIVTGDMGCWVFSRLSDMFEFFRMDDRDFNYHPERKLHINPGYWAEKCRAEDRTGDGIKSFSPELFKAAVKEEFDQHMEYIGSMGKDEYYEGLWDDLESSVISYAHDGQHSAISAAMEFRHGQFTMQDFYEHRLDEYNYHFIWILYAIVWGISKYDEEKACDNKR